jgi:FkbM family methyltransferase
VIRLYRALFCRRALFRFNRAVYLLALHGMGVLNHEDSRVSGEAEFLRRFSRTVRDATVIDVGAHEGSYALEVARLVPGARIFAFEAHPETFKRLEAASSGFTPVHAALASEGGNVVLYDRGSSTGTQHASIVPNVIEKIHADASARRFEVPGTTLDRFVSERRIERIHLLKIDTEGSELEVLRGARRCIDAGALDVVQIEFNAMNTISKVFLRDFRELLRGYTVYRLLPDGPASLDRLDPVFEEIFAFQNLVFLSPHIDPAALETIVG